MVLEYPVFAPYFLSAIFAVVVGYAFWEPFSSLFESKYASELKRLRRLYSGVLRVHTGVLDTAPHSNSNFEIFSINRPMSDSEVASEYFARGLAPASPYALAAWAEQNKTAEIATVWFSGSVPCRAHFYFNPTIRERGVCIAKNDSWPWAVGATFAGVRI